MAIKVCVTGATGFVGQNLLELGKTNKDITIIPFKGDLLAPKEVTTYFNTHTDIDVVVHLAGSFFGDNQTLMEANVLTTANLLDAMQVHEVKKIIYTSTGAVYGEPIKYESMESDPLLPNTFYGLVKLCGEETVRFHHRTSGIEYKILRFPNVYGPKNEKGVIYNLITNIKTKGEVIIYGDGTQSRNFLHVQDACQAILLALDHSISGEFNISNPVKTSINDLVKLLQKEYKFKINHLPADNALKDLLLNIDLAQTKLGFKPQVQELKFSGIV